MSEVYHVIKSGVIIDEFDEKTDAIAFARKNGAEMVMLTRDFEPIRVVWSREEETCLY